MEFLLASSNQHKVQEFNEFLVDSKLNVFSPENKLQVVEDGESFTENALKKAQAYFKTYKKPVLSDDSGIVVEAIPDKLGIYSARYGGDSFSDKERALLLLKEMEGVENRKAYFVCVLCFYLSPDEVYFFEGRCRGKIIDSYLGELGFGYDPVFQIEGQQDGETAATDPEFKSKNSHRFQAVKQAISFFNKTKR